MCDRGHRPAVECASPALILFTMLARVSQLVIRKMLSGWMVEKMTTETQAKTQDWFLARLKRHTGEVFKLAWPAILSRLGIMTLALVDTIMVGRFATQELAYLQLGSGTAIMLITVVAIGLVIGTLVYTAEAYGREDYAECGRVWRRSMFFSGLAGISASVLALPGEWILTLAGQSPELAAGGGRVMTVLALGVTGHVIYVNCVFFLEGLERPKISMYVAAIGNIVNVGLNYVLIYGVYGFPEMGAEGSAWATTILRLLMGGTMVAYVLLAPSMAKYELRVASKTAWSAWRPQRHMGYANAVSMGAEVFAFGALSFFAGLMGTLPLAAWGIIFNVLAMTFMLAIGFGAAASVRVGIAKARKDARDSALAGWVALGLATGALALLGWLIVGFAPEIASFYTSDSDLILLTVPAMLLLSWMVVLDGQQAVISNALRGLGETWVPTAIQSFTYLVIMLPVSYVLALKWGRGVGGLVEAAIIASLISALLQGWRFHVMAKKVG